MRNGRTLLCISWHLAAAGDNQFVGATHTARLGFVLLGEGSYINRE